MKDKILGKWGYLVVISFLLVLVIILGYKSTKRDEDFLVEDYKNELKKKNNEISENNAKINNLNSDIQKKDDLIKELEEKNCTGIDIVTEKTCEYIDTYEFLGYCDEITYDDNRYCVLFSQEFGKEGPFLEILDESKFKKDFSVGNSYEITFKKHVIYDRNLKTFKEYTEILKIEKTDKLGIEQSHDLCVLE